MECERLSREASAAVHRHLYAIDRLELAKLRRDVAMLEPLEIVVKDTAVVREQAVEALREHLAGHRDAEEEPKAKETGASGTA